MISCKTQHGFGTSKRWGKNKVPVLTDLFMLHMSEKALWSKKENIQFGQFHLFWGGAVVYRCLIASWVLMAVIVIWKQHRKCSAPVVACNLIRAFAWNARLEIACGKNYVACCSLWQKTMFLPQAISSLAGGSAAILGNCGFWRLPS